MKIALSNHWCHFRNTLDFDFILIIAQADWEVFFSSSFKMSDRESSESDEFASAESEAEVSLWYL